MRRWFVRLTVPLCPLCSGVALLALAWFSPAQSSDYRSGYAGSYYYPYSGYQAHENLRLRREMDDLGQQVQRQQRLLDEQVRQQQEQTRLLRQQQTARWRMTARQACYYRTEGGLELCDSLFDADPDRHATCVATVKQLNPGCAEDLARPASRAAE